MKQYRVISISEAMHYLIKLESVKRKITMKALIEEAAREYIKKGEHG